MNAQSKKLVVMASQIAEYFRAYPREQATRSIADHINKFWTRKMRDEFLILPEIKEETGDALIVAASKSIRRG